MQIISDYHSVQRFLSNLAGAMDNEAFEWNGWHLLHVFPMDAEEAEKEFPGEDFSLSVARLLRLLLPDGDGAIMMIPDGSLIVLVNQGGGGDPFADLVESLEHSTEIRVPSMHLITLNVFSERPASMALVGYYLSDFFATPLPQEEPELLYSLAPHLGNFMNAWGYLTQGRLDRKKPHLLIVDDDPLTRRIVRAALGERYPVVTAVNAAEAVEKHLLLVPDIVFLDIGLPDCDGFRILDHIRSCDPQCQVVMFSGNSFLENRLKALNHGATGFLPKPFSRLQFEHYIDDWMRDHRAA